MLLFILQLSNTVFVIYEQFPHLAILHLANVQLFCPPPQAPSSVLVKFTLVKVQFSKKQHQNLVCSQIVLLKMQLQKFTFLKTTSVKSDFVKS